MCSCNRPPDRTWLFQRSAHFCQNVLLSSCKKRSLFCKAMARICHSEGFKGERQLACCRSLLSPCDDAVIASAAVDDEIADATAASSCGPA